MLLHLKQTRHEETLFVARWVAGWMRLLAIQNHQAFDVAGLGEEIEGLGGAHRVAAFGQQPHISRQCAGMTRDVGDLGWAIF